MASIKGKRIFVISVIAPLVSILSFFLGIAIHGVIFIIGIFSLYIIIGIARRMRCPRCGKIINLLDGFQNKNLFINPLLCENCGYNFNEDVGKARKKNRKGKNRRR